MSSCGVIRVGRRNFVEVFNYTSVVVYYCNSNPKMFVYPFGEVK
jgi:hypothetical protein